VRLNEEFDFPLPISAAVVKVSSLERGFDASYSTYWYCRLVFLFPQGTTTFFRADKLLDQTIIFPSAPADAKWRQNWRLKSAERLFEDEEEATEERRVSMAYKLTAKGLKIVSGAIFGGEALSLEKKKQLFQTMSSDWKKKRVGEMVFLRTSEAPRSSEAQTAAAAAGSVAAKLILAKKNAHVKKEMREMALKSMDEVE